MFYDIFLDAKFFNNFNFKKLLSTRSIITNIAKWIWYAIETFDELKNFKCRYQHIWQKYLQYFQYKKKIIYINIHVTNPYEKTRH